MVPNGSLDEVLAGTDKTADDVFGSVPYTRSVTTQTVLLAVPRGDRSDALGYLGSTDALGDRVAIRSGEAPKPSNGGPIQIIVPPAMLHDLKVHVGDTVTLAPYAQSKATPEFRHRRHLGGDGPGRRRVAA